jgi:hypothetical protein
MCTPDYIKVTPTEIASFGPAAAIVLAHIRWRCETGGPARILDRDGCRWWRVTQTELGHECGLTRQSLRTALKALGDALVVANNFDPLEPKVSAYRPQVSDQQLVESNPVTQATDQRLVSSNQTDAESDGDVVSSNQGCGWNQPEVGLDLTNALYIETLETRPKDEDHVVAAATDLDAVLDAAPSYVENAAKPAKRQPTSAAMCVVRQELGSAGYMPPAIRRIAVQVGDLYHWGGVDAYIRETLHEWDGRTDCEKPEFIPTVYSDVVKRHRAKPATNGHTMSNGDAKVHGFYDTYLAMTTRTSTLKGIQQ